MVYLKFIFHLLFLSFLKDVHNRRLPSNAGLTVTEMIANSGYPVESHEVQTEDGYVLTLHRIPHGIRTKGSSYRKAPVLIVHGLLHSSADFVLLGPNKSLSFLLSDAGYDVWLANNRGNTWSRKHVVIDPDQEPAKFFDFSFHEIGVYDLPACIDYILNRTKHQQLFYVGHSQGATSFFVMGSERPEYNDKIKLMIGLAPVAYDGNVRSPVFRTLAKNLDFITKFMKNSNIHEVFRHYDLITTLGYTVCSDGSQFQPVCAELIFRIGGYNPAQLNQTILPVIYSVFPAGIAIKQLFHYLQIVRSGKFSKYDYGPQENLDKYQTMVPPSYDLSRVRAPVVLYYAKNDLLSSVADVERSARELPNVKALNLMKLPSFSHFDFLWATDIDILLNNNIVADLESNT